MSAEQNVSRESEPSVSSPHSSPGEVEAANEYERRIAWTMADRVANVQRWLPTDDVSTARRDLASLVEQLEAAQRELRNAERMAAAIVYATPENKVRVYPLHLRAGVVLERADELDDTIVFRSVLREAYTAQPEDADGQPLALGEPPETHDPGAPESAHAGGSDSFPASEPKP